MNQESLDIDRIRALDLWRWPLDVEPLPGGITNHNYVVRDAGRVCVARICADRSILGIDRRSEVVCHRAAHALGIAPEIVHHEDGILVSRFVPGRTLTPAEVRAPTFLPRLAAILRRLHDAWDGLTGEMLYFSAFQTARTYARTAQRLGAALPGDIEALLDGARALARSIAPFVPSLCHNDLLAGNLLADADRVWLVDWEYAGIGHPLFDLGNFSANCGLGDEQEIELLRAYRGEVTPRDVRELRILKAMSLLRESLWSSIQTVASDIAFDYAKYAEDNLAAYRSAVARP